MTKQAVIARILEIGIVPVVRADTAERALLAAEAVRTGGIPIVEITMTVPGAIETIRRLAAERGREMLIGAGTVLDAASAEACVAAGAQFLVTPGFDRDTVQFARQKDVVIMAGALTPTEIMAARKAGADFVKIFPCSNVGGAKYIKALRGPFPDVPLVPTGGVNLDTAAEFLKAGSAALGIGGELVLPQALKAGTPAAITELARKYVEIVKSARAG
jgi:2-dehydro-3-deoxyphosphogluconate aldolase/(4S)-4-hydroxy-2-oxoglutarate aldolase